jgi:peroxiredoxin Q/BCP
MTTKTTKSTKKSATTTASTAKGAPAMRDPKGALQPGDKAPAFALPDQTGTIHKLGDHKGRKLLVYFYPKADTPGCTTQSCSVRDARRDLVKLGVDAVGISPDKPAAQQKFDTKYALGFPLLADEDHAVAEAFGVWGEKSMYGRKYMGIVRSAFLIDEKGKIAHAWYGVSPKDTVPGTLAALAG